MCTVILQERYIPEDLSSPWKKNLPKDDELNTLFTMDVTPVFHRGELHAREKQSTFF